MAAKKQQTFEQAMDRLEVIVKTLESGEGSLDESMALFEEGSRLAAACSAMLDKAEQKVTRLLVGEDGEQREVPFDGEAGLENEPSSGV